MHFDAAVGRAGPGLMVDNAVVRLRRRRDIANKLRRRCESEAQTPYQLPVDVVGTGLEEEGEREGEGEGEDGDATEETPRAGSSGSEGDGRSAGRRRGHSGEGVVQQPEDSVFLIEGRQKARARKLLRKGLEDEDIAPTDPKVEKGGEKEKKRKRGLS